MNDNEYCYHCGAPKGLHHYETNQCPKGGREARIEEKQEYSNTTFVSRKKELLTAIALELLKNLKEVTSFLEKVAGGDDEWCGNEECYKCGTTIKVINAAKAIIAKAERE